MEQRLPIANVLKDVMIRQREVRLKLQWSEIKRLIDDAVLRALSPTGSENLDRAVIKVDLKQEERGSPSYSIGEWSAIVDITVPIDAPPPGPKV